MKSKIIVFVKKCSQWGKIQTKKSRIGNIKGKIRANISQATLHIGPVEDTILVHLL